MLQCVHRTDWEQKDCKTCSEKETVTPCQTLKADSVVASLAHSVIGQPQNKGLSPDIVLQISLKYMKDVSYADLLSFVQNFTNVPVAAVNRPVGSDCTNFEKLGKP